MTYIIAEISGNHGGFLYKALELIECAADCGADAAKFQLYKPEDLHDPANNEIYQKSQVPTDWLPSMFKLAADLKIDLFASVFAPWAVEELRKYEPKYYKIASPESTRLPDYSAVVNAIRETKTPIIWSMGRDETLLDQYYGVHDYLMYCKQGYPATLDVDDYYYIKEYDGFSDHTVGISAALLATAWRVTVIEKHFKIDDDCIDAAFSINPKELRALCDLS